MRQRAIKNFSLSVSLLLHLTVFVSFMIFNFKSESTPPDLLEITFGNGTGTGSPSGSGTELIQNMPDPETKSTEISKDVKGVDLRKSGESVSNEVSEPIGKVKNTIKENAKGSAPGGIGSGGEGPGGFGIGIDWGGGGNRKIYSYVLPAYPEGVDKEINIKLRFSILPDGTVGTIIPLTKADTRLEDAAINSLRQWRFEALSPQMKKIEQAAVIVFPYRLH
jgi:protein TonB